MAEIYTLYLAITPPYFSLIEFKITDIELKAIAPSAITGCKRPIIAKGIATPFTLQREHLFLILKY